MSNSYFNVGTYFMTWSIIYHICLRVDTSVFYVATGWHNIDYLFEFTGLTNSLVTAPIPPLREPIIKFNILGRNKNLTFEPGNRRMLMGSFEYLSYLLNLQVGSLFKWLSPRSQHTLPGTTGTRFLCSAGQVLTRSGQSCL